MTGVVTEVPFPTYPDGFPPEVVEAFTRDRRASRRWATSRPRGPRSSPSWAKSTSAPAGRSSTPRPTRCSRSRPTKRPSRWRPSTTGASAPARCSSRPTRSTGSSRGPSSGRRGTIAARRIVETTQSRRPRRSWTGSNWVVCPCTLSGRFVTSSAVTGSRRPSASPTTARRWTARSLSPTATDHGLVFVNLNDFDTKYGHRRDVRGYGEALVRLDRRIPELLERIRPGDGLIFTADHGCDPTHPGSDHTREFVPYLEFGPDAGAGAGRRRGAGLRRRADRGPARPAAHDRRRADPQRHRAAATAGTPR